MAQAKALVQRGHGPPDVLARDEQADPVGRGRDAVGPHPARAEELEGTAEHGQIAVDAFADERNRAPIPPERAAAEVAKGDLLERALAVDVVEAEDAGERAGAAQAELAGVGAEL